MYSIYCYVLFTQKGALVNLKTEVQLLLTLIEHNCFITLIFLNHFQIHERIVIFFYLMFVLLK